MITNVVPITIGLRGFTHDCKVVAAIDIVELSVALAIAVAEPAPEITPSLTHPPGHYSSRLPEFRKLYNFCFIEKRVFLHLENFDSFWNLGQPTKALLCY